MKKFILISFIVLVLSSFAYAQMDMGGCWYNEINVTSSAQAADIVKGIIPSKDGYVITNTEEIKHRRGTSYKVSVKNKSGNIEYYVVTACGMTRGPLTLEVANSFCNTGCINNYGHGMWHGMKGGKGIHMGEPIIVTDSQAKNAVEKHIQQLKGYYIESVESFNKVGGGMTFYRVYVKDGSGNSFFFYVDPWGRVGGQTAYTRTK